MHRNYCKRVPKKIRSEYSNLLVSLEAKHSQNRSCKSVLEIREKNWNTEASEPAIMI